ncbi:MAG: imelysin family protein [Amaricoccus sp.]
MHLALAALALAAAVPAAAAPDQAALARRALAGAILPGYQRFADAAAILAAEADGACSGEGPIEAGPVRDAFNGVFDAWIAVEEFHFGPAADAAPGIAGWPASEAATPPALAALRQAEDPVVDDRAAFAAAPAADHGLFAVEYLLFDPAAQPLAGDDYSCRLLMAVARNLSDAAAATSAAWRDRRGHALTTAGAAGNTDWPTAAAATAALYRAIPDALAFDDRRLAADGKPEAWRSERSLRNVALSLAALRGYAAAVFAPALPPDAAARVDAAFAAALDRADAAGAPLDSAAGRTAAAPLRQVIEQTRTTVAAEIAPALGIAAGED